MTVLSRVKAISDAHPYWMIFLIALLLAGTMQFLEFKGVLSAAEGKAADMFLVGETSQTGEHRVVTVGIDDSDYETFFDSRSPLDPKALSGLIGALVKDSKAAVVAVDLLTDSEDWSTVRDNPAFAKVVWATDAPRQELARAGFLPWMFSMAHDELAVVPGRILGFDAPPPPDKVPLWGLPIFPRDGDGAVRRFPRVWVDAREHEAFGSGASRYNTFASVIVHCALLGRPCRPDDDEPEEVFLRFREATLEAPDHSVGKLLACAGRGEAAAGREGICERWQYTGSNTAFEDAIVILGGTFRASHDVHETPAGRVMSGLALNAAAVSAELAETKLHEPPRWVILLADLIIGCLVGVSFHLPAHRTRVEVLCAAVVIVVGLFLAWMFLFGTAFLRLLILVAAVGIPTGLTYWFGRQTPMRTGTARSVLLGLAVAVLSVVVFGKGHYLWLSWAGMLLTALPWHITIESLKHSPSSH